MKEIKSTSKKNDLTKDRKNLAGIEIPARPKTGTAIAIPNISGRSRFESHAGRKTNNKGYRLKHSDLSQGISENKYDQANVPSMSLILVSIQTFWKSCRKSNTSVYSYLKEKTKLDQSIIKKGRRDLVLVAAVVQCGFSLTKILLLVFFGGKKMDKTNKKENIKEYYLVDFASRLQKGFRNNMVSVHFVPSFIKKYDHYECYTTHFLFPEEIREHMQKNKNTKTGRPSISGYEGEVKGNYLPIDIDSRDLSRAQSTAKKLVRYILNELRADRKAVLTYFSGSAGFHLMIDIRTFGEIQPSKGLHLLFSSMRSVLVDKSRVDRETVDFAIKDKVRLWRLPDTRNEKSGLYKIQLTLRDLFRSSPYQIRQKARKPQSVYYTDRTGLIPLIRNIKSSEKAELLYKEALKLSRKTECQKKEVSAEGGEQKDNKDLRSLFCKAEQAIASNNMAEGLRNNSATRLISKIRTKGFDHEEAEEFVKEWNTENKVGLDEGELLTIVRSVYSKNHFYDYGCNDEILKKFCPYKDRDNCRDYRIHKVITITE